MNSGEVWLSEKDVWESLESGDGEGVRIAVIDSGIDFSHPDLQGIKIGDNLGILEDRGRIRVQEGEGEDVYGHGTAVTSILYQVAPKVEVGNFRVLDARNVSRSEIIREGARQAILRGYHIIHCSFGCKSGARSVMQYKDWVDEAYLNGCHVVAASNNLNRFEPEWPGHFTSVITVNMVRSESPYFFKRPGQMVQFAARGENVETAWLNHERVRRTGSSFAVPRVAGYVARILSGNQNISPSMMLDLLQKTALPWDEDLTCSE